MGCCDFDIDYQISIPNDGYQSVLCCSMYTLGQKFSDFFLHMSNLQINLSGLLQKFAIL